MTRWLAMLLILALGSPLVANDYPALHDVTGVAMDDMLNVRSAPDAGSPIVGRIGPDASDVEVVRLSENRRWGLVTVGDVSGWASLQYLARTTPPITGLPGRLRCVGTEPFWTLLLPGSGEITLHRLDGGKTAADIEAVTRSENRTDRFGLTAEGLFATFSVQQCGDGMSDRAYGMSVDLLVPTNGTSQHLSGCCSLAY